MREEAGEPQELQLEREHERVERGTFASLRLSVVERVEETGEREERAVVLLFLGVELQHRLEPDESDLEAVAVGADPVVGADERRAGDGR